MNGSFEVPAELEALVAALVARASPRAIWLFGSRARGDHRPDSDWDLAIALEDAAPSELFDPLTYWFLPRSLGVKATIVPVSAVDLEESWGQPNTLGYDLARDGKRLNVCG
jgi:hypothetical protein